MLWVIFANFRCPIPHLIKLTQYFLSIVTCLPFERSLALLAHLQEVSFVHPLRLLLRRIPLLFLLILTLLLLFLPPIPYLREVTLNLFYTLHTLTHHHTYHLIITLEQFVSLLLEGGEPAIVVLESLLFLQAAVVLDVTARVLLQPVLLLVLVHRRLAEGYVHARGRLA
jgi:hypothetical protein